MSDRYSVKNDKKIYPMTISHENDAWFVGYIIANGFH